MSKAYEEQMREEVAAFEEETGIKVEIRNGRPFVKNLCIKTEVTKIPEGMIVGNFWVMKEGKVKEPITGMTITGIKQYPDGDYSFGDYSTIIGSKLYEEDGDDIPSFFRYERSDLSAISKDMDLFVSPDYGYFKVKERLGQSTFLLESPITQELAYGVISAHIGGGYFSKDIDGDLFGHVFLSKEETADYLTSEDFIKYSFHPLDKRFPKFLVRELPSIFEEVCCDVNSCHEFIVGFKSAPMDATISASEVLVKLFESADDEGDFNFAERFGMEAELDALCKLV